MTCASAAAAEMTRESRAADVVVMVEPEEFEKILAKSSEPLVVCAEGGFWSRAKSYLTNYRGLVFFTRSDESLRIPSDADVIRAKRISLPG